MSDTNEIRSALIISYDDNSRCSIETTLVEYGYSCSVAKDGKRGLELFSSTEPDIVITDVYMPEMDGLGVILSIRRLTNSIPIIVMSESSCRYLNIA